MAIALGGLHWELSTATIIRLDFSAQTDISISKDCSEMSERMTEKL